MKQFSILFAVALALTQCDSSSVDDSSAFLGVSSLAVTIAPEGGAAAVTVDNNTGDWTSQLAGGDGWLTTEKVSNGVRLTAVANSEEAGARTATLTIASAQAGASYPVTVTQTSAYSPFITVDKPADEYDGGGADISLAVTSNVSDWAVESDAAWLTVQKASGSIRATLEINKGILPRSANIIISSAKYPEVYTLVEVNQKGIVPILKVQSGDPLKIAMKGGSASVAIESNVTDYLQYTTQENWITTSAPSSILTVTCPENTMMTRTGKVLISSEQFPEISAEVTVIQQGYVFAEDFSWLAGTATAPLSDDIFTSTNEKRFDSWASTYGSTNGWTSTPIRDAGTTAYPWVYSRNGYAKFSKTSYNGDLITPKFTEIQGARNLVVTFKACGYTSAGSATSAGTLDPIKYTNGTSGGHADVPNELNIEILGGGTASQTNFVIDNYPDDSRRLHGAGWKWQSDPNALRTFKITGATSQTQIRFIAGKKIGISTDDGTTNGTYYTYRHGLDDVYVAYDD